MAVNLSPVGGVAAQFFTNTGSVLTGGKLYTYAAGTTTPAPTYTSSSGNTAHTNPIVLDAAGRIPATGEVWLADGVQYKFVLKTSTDVLIATYDNIVGINSNFVNYTNQQEIQTATAGQTVFTLTGMTYQPGTNSLSVFVDGVNQYGSGAQYAYVETDATTVTFVSGLHVGAEVKFTTSQINASSYGDAFQISYTPPFTDSVPTNVGDKLAQTISVKDFGAVGDGATDDTAAIQAAIAYAGSVGPDSVNGKAQCKIYFPAGTYIVSDGVLSTPTYRYGGHFVGDGWQSTILRFGTLSSDAYMFNNSTFTDGEAFFVYENMGFEGTTASNYNVGTIPTFAKFGRLYSNGLTQGLKFINCRVSGFDQVMILDGTNTASEVRWVNCKITHTQANVLYLDNTQSVNHEFIGCDVENILGDAFVAGANGGGSIHVFGGSWIINNTGSIFKLNGSLAGPNLFSGTRFEFRDTSKFFDGTAGAYYAKIVAHGCTINTTETAGTNELVSFREYQEVLFDSCQFATNGAIATYKCYTTQTQVGGEGNLRFVNCQGDYQLSDRITFSADVGHVSVENFSGMNYGAITTNPYTYALDFDLGGGSEYPYVTGGGAGNANFKVKRVFLKPSYEYWPRNDGFGNSVQEVAVKLPLGAIIKGIILREYGQGGSAANLQYQITNNDKTVVHAISNLAQQSDPHTITLNDYFYYVGYTDNERIIRMSINPAITGTGANQLKSLGFGYIEYI